MNVKRRSKDFFSRRHFVEKIVRGFIEPLRRRGTKANLRQSLGEQGLVEEDMGDAVAVGGTRFQGHRRT